DKVPQDVKLDTSGDTAVFDIVDGISKFIGPVHGLRFHRRFIIHVALAQPVKDMCVFIVGTVFAVDAAIRVRLGFGVLARGIEGRAGEIKAYGVPLIIDDLGLQAGKNAQGLCVAFKAAAFGGYFIKRVFTVVAIGRVPDVVGQPGHLTQVGIKAQAGANAAGNLGDF